MVYIDLYASPLGNIYVAVEEGFLIGLWLEKQKYFAATIIPKEQQPWDKAITKSAENTALLQQVYSWLDQYFAGKRPDPLNLALKPQGSPFRQRVWQELLKIPYGQVTTYGVIAKTIAAEKGVKTMSAQAVGGAVGHNPISIIVPCHRVMGGDGSLTGYAGGVDKKLWLLQHEGLSFDASGKLIKA